jgi:ATP-binding cassette subfamily B protein/subfamily B ATP-binding cassette protein MsbA
MPADGARARHRRAYRRLLRYAWPYKGGWASIIAATLLTTGLTLLQPWPLKVLVDDVLGGRRPELLALVVFGGLAIFAFNGVIDVVLSVQWTRVGRGMVYDLARDLFAHVQRRSLRTYGAHSVGDSMGRVAVDAWCIHTVVDTLLFAPGHALVSMLVMVVVMWQLDAGLTLLALAVAPLMTAAALAFGRPIRRAAHDRRDVETRIQTHVHQTLTGVTVVQAFAREDDEQRRFQELASAAIRAHQRGALIGSVYGLASGLLTTMGTAAVMWAAAMRVLDGRLTLGTALVFLAYLGSLQWQLSVFATAYTALQGAGASLDRVMAVFDDDGGLPERSGAPALPPARGHVVLENITFGYNDEQPVESSQARRRGA